MLGRVKVTALCLGCALALAAMSLGVTASRYRATIPTEYRRNLDSDAAGWLIDVGTPDASNRLGPIKVGEIIPAEVLSRLGAPDESRMPYPYSRSKRERDSEPGWRMYYGLGLLLNFFQHEKENGIKEPGIWQIILGNPQANSADDPIVQACPFALSCGLKLGATLDECRSRIPMISKLRPNLFKEVLQGDGVRYHFARNRLIAIEVYDQPTRTTPAGTPPPQGIKLRAEP